MPRSPSRWRRWLREPLLHFLLIGAALFAMYAALRPGSNQGDRTRRIELTPDDVRQLQVAFLAKWQRSPNPEELAALLATKLHTEILYREALALGLDQQDEIVKRRMAQKMEFLAENLADLREPRREELEAWFAKNPERFAVPGRISFRHLYFSFDNHGERTEAAAAQALKKLEGQPAVSAAAAALGDPFMFQDDYGDRSFDEISQTFGKAFAQSLGGLKAGSWQGPVESGYGWHLVFVDFLTPAHVPAFEEVEPEVRTQWVAARREEAKKKVFEAMMARYQIVLPQATPPPDSNATASAEAETK